MEQFDTTYTEIQYDKAELKVNEARIEIIPEGILIYASPNNFLKLTRDGLELSGTTIMQTHYRQTHCQQFQQMLLTKQVQVV